MLVLLHLFVFILISEVLFENHVCEKVSSIKIIIIIKENINLHKHYHVFKHGCEPSRIPKRTLELLRNKVKFTPEYTMLSWLCYARAVKQSTKDN